MKKEAKHIMRKAEIMVDARPEEVFPLLCPVREYEWIPQWKCELVHCPEGVIGPDTVFTTRPEGIDEVETWTVIRHEPENFTLSFMRFIPGVCVTRMDIALRREGESRTSLVCGKTLTSLGEQGDASLDAYTSGEHESWLAGMGSLLNVHFREIHS